MTQLRLRSLAAASLIAVLGCTDSVAPAQGELTGSWVSQPDLHLPDGWYQRHLVFTTGGRFASEARSYGTYPGQPANQLSSFTRSEGTFRDEGDRLVFAPERLVWWDRFYGDDSPVRVEQPYPWGGVFDDATFDVSEDRLTIHFTVYPADAPEPATAVYTRVK